MRERESTYTVPMFMGKRLADSNSRSAWFVALFAIKHGHSSTPQCVSNAEGWFSNEGFCRLLALESKSVSWCFTPSQPLRLYQGDLH